MKKLFVPGVFDVFHIGHLNYIKRASRAGDYIIVGVQDDRSVFQSKGVKPVIPLAERVAIIESLKFVDEVVSYTSVFQGALLGGLKINVLAIGEEYGQGDLYPDQKKTLAFCQEHGIEIVRIPRTTSVSSTAIRGRLKEFWNSRAQLKDKLTSGVTVLGSFQGDQERVSEETRLEVDLIIAAAGNSAEQSLLDLGCGDGRQLVPLSGVYKRVVGVDFASSLLDIAERNLSKLGRRAELVESDVVSFLTEEQFDILLLSGILPYLDDEQAGQMLSHLGKMSHDRTKLLVRSSIGLAQRVDVVNQFSAELGAQYTGYYRTIPEIEIVFAKVGWIMIRKEQLYKHREDTAVWWFEFVRSDSSPPETGASEGETPRVSDTFKD